MAVARVRRLIASEGLAAEVVGFEAIGVDLRLPASADVLAEVDRLADAATAEGVVLRPPRELPPTALAHVVAEVAAEAGALAEFDRRAYAAFWQHAAALDDPAVLRELGTAAGLARGAVDAALDDRVRLAGVRRRAGQHRRDGVGGVPTILAQRTLVPGLLADDDLRALAALG